MALYGGRPAGSLTISDAITTGFRMATQVNFIAPLIVIGVVVNLIVITAFVPLLVGLVAGGDDAGLFTGGIIASIVGGLIAATIGGVLLNLYGMVWATMASEGPMPTMQAAFGRVALRWIPILGAGIIVALAGMGIFLVGAILEAALGALGVVLLLVGLVAGIYIGARLSLAGWLAADGAAAMEAVQTSWALSASKVGLILGWGIVAGIVFAIVGGILSAILGIIPLIGQPVAAAVTTAFGYGSGVTIYRKVTAREGAAAPAAMAADPASPAG